MFLCLSLCLAGGFNPQFFPTLESVEALFRRPFTAASFLLHVLAINLIAARSAYIDGELDGHRSCAGDPQKGSHQ